MFWQRLRSTFSETYLIWPRKFSGHSFRPDTFALPFAPDLPERYWPNGTVNGDDDLVPIVSALWHDVGVATNLCVAQMLTTAVRRHAMDVMDLVPMIFL